LTREDPNQGIRNREFTVYYEPFCQTLYIKIILAVRIFVWSHNITFCLYTWTDRTLFCKLCFRLDQQRTQSALGYLDKGNAFFWNAIVFTLTQSTMKFGAPSW